MFVDTSRNRIGTRIKLTPSWKAHRSHSEMTLIVSTAFSLTAILLLRTDLLTREDRNFWRAGDHHAYIAMAKGNPLDATEVNGRKCYMVPYCWRIATPVIAKALPFDLQYNFLLIAIVSTGLTGVVTYHLAKGFGFSPIYAFSGMLTFYSMRWTAKWGLYDFWVPDALSLLLIGAAVYCAIKRNDIGFVGVMLLGVAVKETMLLVAPLYYTFNARRLIDLRVAIRFLLLLIPAVAVLIGLRIIIPSSGFTTHDEDIWARVGRILAARVQAFDWPSGPRRHLLAPFGVMTVLLPFFAPRRNAVPLLKFLPFIVMAYAQLLIASNTERLLVVAYPAILLLALHGLAQIGTVTSVDPKYLSVLPLSALVTTVVTSSTSRFEPPSIIRTQMWVFLVGLVLVFFIRDLVVPHSSFCGGESVAAVAPRAGLHRRAHNKDDSQPAVAHEGACG